MSDRPTLLCDVDGVVANLMRGFTDWLQHYTFGEFPDFDAQKMPLFDIRHAARTPDFKDLDDKLRGAGYWPYLDKDGGINGAFMQFMNRTDSYDWTPLIAGAKDGIAKLQEKLDVVFVTALMDAAPDHIPSKFRWLKRHFPTVPVFTAPSKLKSYLKGQFGIDDRYDTCVRWSEAGTTPFLFKQAWNEAPAEQPRFDWSNLPEAVLTHVTD